MILALIQPSQLSTPPDMDPVQFSGGPLASVSPEAMLAGGVVVLGLMLWISGGRMLKPAIVLSGILIGSIFGSALASGLRLPDFQGVPAPYAGLGLGGLLGLGLSLALYRVAIAGIAGVSLGAASATAAALCIGIGAHSTSPTTASDQDAPHSSRLAQVRDHLSTLSLNDLDQIRAHLAEHVETRTIPTGELVPTSLRGAGEQIGDSAMSHWSALSAQPRLILLASAILGTLIGMLMGLFSPRKASTLITGLAGAALWMVGVASLVGRYAPELTQQEWVAWALAHPPAWVVIWIMLGVTGAAVQRSGDPKPTAAPPAPKAA